MIAADAPIVKLRLSIFSNYGTVPLQIAVQHGFFEEVGLTVDIEPTTSSVKQMTGVVDGRYDIAATAVDNIIAYNCGQGEASTVGTSDLKVFLGSASYRLPFVVASDIETFVDLKGHTIAVDAISTGFAFLLREIATVLRLREKYTHTCLGITPENLCDRRVIMMP